MFRPQSEAGFKKKEVNRKTMAIDPVCKMTVDEKTAKFTTEYQGKTYYFCAPGCKKTFEENPEDYLD
jgi:YHS domain-containing protein